MGSLNTSLRFGCSQLPFDAEVVNGREEDVGCGLNDGRTNVEGRRVIVGVAEGRIGKIMGLEAPQRMLEKNDSRGACIVCCLTLFLEIAELSND